MGKVNTSLKRSYQILTSLVAITSSLLLAFSLFSHGYFHTQNEADHAIRTVYVLYLISILSLVLALLGLYGACKKKKWALIVFAIGMIIGSLFLTLCLIPLLFFPTQLTKEIQKRYLDMLPLANASGSFYYDLWDTQMNMQCCGLDKGYLDWDYSIPESCLCTEESTKPCVPLPMNISLAVDKDQPVMIYKESCLPHYVAQEMMYIDALRGIILGIVLLWVSSISLSIILLCQMKRKEDTPVVFYSPEAKAGNYDALAESGGGAALYHDGEKNSCVQD